MPYISVSECVDAILYGFQNADEEVNCFNLSCNGATTVTAIAESVIRALKLSDVQIEYTGGKRGWKGDVDQVRLDPSAINALGWKARYSSDEAVNEAARVLAEQMGEGK